MEGLADEMLLDTAVKEAFFSIGDVFFEIARRLEESAAAATTAAADAAAVRHTALGDEDTNSRLGGGERDNPWAAVTDARRLAATAAVLDAAFFHSLQVPKRIDLVARAMPISLPALAEILVKVYSDVRGRLLKHNNGDDGGCGDKYRCKANQQTFGISPVEADFKSGRSNAGVGREEEGIGTTDTVDPREEIATGMLDRVVRALNGMGDVSFPTCFIDKRVNSVYLLRGRTNFWNSMCGDKSQI